MNRKLIHIPRADEVADVDDIDYYYDEGKLDYLIDMRFDAEATDCGVVISRTTEVMG